MLVIFRIVAQKNFSGLILIFCRSLPAIIQKWMMPSMLFIRVPRHIKTAKRHKYFFFKTPASLTFPNDQGFLFLYSSLMVNRSFEISYLWLLQIFESYSYWTKCDKKDCPFIYVEYVLVSYPVKSSGRHSGHSSHEMGST